MIRFKPFGFGKSEEPKPVVEAPSLPSQTPVNPNGKRVLIVDDDPVFLKATAMKLESSGLRVRTVKEGAEAITALNDQPADVVLMDINFPPDVANGGMGSWDGFQLMNWLRGSPASAGARFIIVSGSDSPSARQRAQQLGAAAYLQKPLDSSQLLAAVNAEN